MDRRGPPGREPSRIDRKSLRHVLYGNNPRSLTRRLQAKLVHERTASRRKRHALGRARPHFPRSTAAPEGAWKTASKIAVTEAAVGELCGLDGVETDGVAETVGVAGDAS